MTWVPARVEDDDPVGAHQVDPEAAGPGAHQEQLDPVTRVEARDEPLPLQGAGAAVQPVVGVPRHPACVPQTGRAVAAEKLFDEIQSKQGLREEQNTIIAL